MIGDLIQQALILTLIGMKHCLTDGCHNLLLIKAHNASVTLYYCLNHMLIEFLVKKFRLQRYDIYP